MEIYSFINGKKLIILLMISKILYLKLKNEKFYCEIILKYLK